MGSIIISPDLKPFTAPGTGGHPDICSEASVNRQKKSEAQNSTFYALVLKMLNTF